MNTLRNEKLFVGSYVDVAAVIAAACSIACSSCPNHLDSGWQFRQAGKPDWHAATVPGCVHTDLLANKLIEDPFYRDNEKRTAVDR